MPSRLGPVAAARHLAPAPPVRSQFVEEDPATLVVGTDPGTLGVPATDRPDERLGQLGQRTVDLVTGKSARQPQARRVRRTGTGLELEDRAMAQDPVDLPDRGGIRRAPLHGRIPQFAERCASPIDPSQRRRRVRHTGRLEAGPLVQPVDRLAGCTKVVELAPTGQARGVDEVDRRLEVDPGIVGGSIIG